MRTLTIEIDDSNLPAVKQFIEELGLKYEVEEEPEIIFSDELKDLLDQRYQAMTDGNAKPISAEESKARVARLFQETKK